MLRNWKWMPAVALGSVAAAIAVMIAVTSQQKPQVMISEPTEKATQNVVEVTAAIPTQEPQGNAQGTDFDVGEVPATVVTNQYVQFKHPTANSAAYVHEQEICGAEVSEKYYMTVCGEKRILYQIDFGKEKEGNWLGLIELDTDDVYITYTISAVSDEEIANMDETERQHYSELMSGLGIVLESIKTDRRFREEKPLPVEEAKTVSLTHWLLELPGNMTWTETNKDGEYQAIFYGMVQEEQIPLYTVRIGDIEAQSVLGKYRVNGQEKTVSVESFDLVQREDWKEEDYSTAYRMMSTINDVIQTIMSSEDFLLK